MWFRRPHRLSEGTQRGFCLVWEKSEFPPALVGQVAKDGLQRGRCGHLGSRCPLPELQHRKARRFLDHEPRYSSLQAVYESLRWLIDHQVIRV